MSKEPEIDWGLVAKKVISTLGVETAKGLYYGILIQGVSPLLIEKMRELASGRSKEEEIKREILELMARQQIPPQMISPQSPQDLERALTQVLAQYGRGSASYPVGQYPYHGPPSPQVRPPIPAYIQQEIESLRSEIRNLEDVKNSLIRKKYETFDDQIVRQIDERIRELENRITDLKLRLQRLEMQTPGWP